MSEPSTDTPIDFVDRILATIDHLLDLVHDRVLRPIILAARVVAYGLVIVAAAVVVVSALMIGLVRLLNVYAFHGRDWLSFAVVGAASMLVGLTIWRRRRPVKLRK